MAANSKSLGLCSQTVVFPEGMGPESDGNVGVVAPIIQQRDESSECGRRKIVWDVVRKEGGLQILTCAREIIGRVAKFPKEGKDGILHELRVSRKGIKSNAPQGLDVRRDASGRVGFVEAFPQCIWGLSNDACALGL